MMGAFALALAAVVTFGPQAAVAPRPPDAAAPAPVPSAPPAVDEAWRAYDDAFRALVQGRRQEARRLVEELAVRHADHPATVRALTLLRLWPAAGAPEPSADAAEAAADAPADAPADADAQADVETGGVERASRSARAELAFFETFHGIAAGIELCVLVDCNSAEAALAFPLLLGGGALAITLASTSDGVRPGTASLLEDGVLWGSWNALALGKIKDARSTRLGGGLLLGQAIGLSVGAGLAATVQPTAGQVSLTTTVGMWTGLLTWFSRGAGNLSTASDASFGSMLINSDIGLAAGALLSAGYPVSRGHALLIDSGGVGGALLGLGVVAIAGGNGARWSTYYKTMVPSTLAGLAAATYLTRDWDVPEPPVAVTLAPSPSGAGAVAMVVGRF
jgi:hypothetical protein